MIPVFWWEYFFVHREHCTVAFKTMINAKHLNNKIELTYYSIIVL